MDQQEQVRLTRLLTFANAVSQALAEAESLESVLPLVLAQAREAAGFSVGRYFAIDRQGSTLRLVVTSGSREASAVAILADGQSLPDWVGADPVWIADTEGDDRARSAVAWTSALLVPVVAAGAAVGVLEFCAAHPLPPDTTFLEVVRAIARQLGHVFSRAAMVEHLRESEERFASTMELAAIGISHVDEAGRFSYVNPQLCAMLGYSERELLGRTVKQVSHHEDVNVTDALVAELRKGSIASFKCEKRYLRKDGTPVWVGLTVTAKRDGRGRSLYDVSIVEDISARKAAECRVRFLASHDPLTGLPNRTSFNEVLKASSDAARRYRRGLAVLFIDLDRFKAVNDTLGHEAGDVLLREVATRLKSCVRASDVVARLGGDEFVVLLPQIAAPSDASIVAESALEALREPVVINGRPCSVSASIGVCLHPDGSQDDSTVLKHADMAMYLAKQSGKNTYRVYVAELEALAAERAQIETLLRGALERRELLARYTLRADATRAIVGVQAELDFVGAELAAFGRDKVLAVASEVGLRVALCGWLLRTACADVNAWQRVGAKPGTLAVDVCLPQIADPRFLDALRGELQRSGPLPGQLELGLPADEVAANPARAARAFGVLKTLGIRAAVTDFGAGQLAFLDIGRLSVDRLKVHGSQLAGVAGDSDTQAHFEGVVAMGRALGIAVVGTGVAHVADAAYLFANGCAAVQGSVNGRPCSASDCEVELLARAAR